jgi:hypothetical protein
MKLCSVGRVVNHASKDFSVDVAAVDVIKRAARNRLGNGLDVG